MTLNICACAFEAARGRGAGTLVVIENVTEARAHLNSSYASARSCRRSVVAAGVAHEVTHRLQESHPTRDAAEAGQENDPKRSLSRRFTFRPLRIGNRQQPSDFSRTGDAPVPRGDINRVLEDTLQLLEPQLRNAEVQNLLRLLRAPSTGIRKRV